MSVVAVRCWLSGVGCRFDCRLWLSVDVLDSMIVSCRLSNAYFDCRVWLLMVVLGSWLSGIGCRISVLILRVDCRSVFFIIGAHLCLV
jgi:hypothetical protein